MPDGIVAPSDRLAAGIVYDVAAALLLDEINNPEKHEHKRVLLEPTLVARQSTAAKSGQIFIKRWWANRFARLALLSLDL